MNYYRRYVGDYLRDTSRLSVLEHGAYNLLLDYYYADERPLPSDLDEVYLMVRAMTPADRKAVDKVLRLYFTLEADGYHNARADHEIRVSQTARGNGGKGGRKPTDDGTGSGTGKLTGLPTGTYTGLETGTTTGLPTGDGAGSGHPPTTNHQPPTASHQKASSDTSPKPETGEARALRLPAHWLPSESLRVWTIEQRPEWSDDRLRREVMQFVDHYDGTGEKRVNWDAAWRKWIRGGIERDRTSGRAPIRTDPAAMDLLLGNADAAH